MQVSKATASILTEPAETFPALSGIISGNEPFTVTARHIVLLRQLRFSWETAETGAPMVDPKAPYGTPDALNAIAAVTGAKSNTDRARQHIEAFFALCRMLRHGSLIPGDYPLRNITPMTIQNTMAGYFEDRAPLNDGALGITSDGKFRLKAEHLKLIKVLMLEWPDSDAASDRLSHGDWPAPTMDPKRPYGDMSYFQADMAYILDLKVEAKDGKKLLSDDQEKALQQVHWQMLGALQVFIENATFEPGVYK